MTLELFYSNVPSLLAFWRRKLGKQIPMKLLHYNEALRQFSLSYNHVCRPKLLPVTVCNLVYWVVAKRMWNYGIPIKEKLKFTLILTFLECWRSVNFKRTFWCHRLNQKTNEICLRISALASKKRSDQKNKCTFLYHWLGAIQRWILQVNIFPHPFIC